MKETDPLNALLSEWKSPEPSQELDQRVVSAYRNAIDRDVQGHAPLWIQFWRARISVPAPVLTLALLAAFAVWIGFRQAPVPSATSVTPNLVTQLNAAGFQPLPNGEARVLPVSELDK